MLLYISDIQLIILSSTMQLFRTVPPFGKVAADKEFPISTDGFRYDFASIFCNKKICYFRVNLLEIVWKKLPHYFGTCLQNIALIRA